MKPLPQANYPINVFTHTAENEGSQLYDGIYGLRLNYSVEVYLCPRYDTAAYGFPRPGAPQCLVSDGRGDCHR
jgi:hypothetical protein